MTDDTQPKPDPTPANPAPETLCAEPLILPLSAASASPWNNFSLKANRALHGGGNAVVIRNSGGQIAAFLPDSMKITPALKTEIAAILADPRYARKPAAPTAPAKPVSAKA